MPATRTPHPAPYVTLQADPRNLSTLATPYLGPLSAANPDLDGLDKVQALRFIKIKVSRLIKFIAPASPRKQPPHKRRHIEFEPRLDYGFSGQLQAGRWYQSCYTCEGYVLQYITDPLDPDLLTGGSELGILYDTLNEIKRYEDGATPPTGTARTRVRY
ncbi:hypothetical protein GALMADRAFT_138820 [Galerina marginata CBS 339.88]|uniref:Uncharacterized protein n=1 Tax=Galerina marginata (strain CBS 339.88) TaxID=685588 RepID=A0A067T3P4_GALM3|nr:hypothetical protein GALMADRAFT_138820 [Galerina marginata CBS 339.88]